MNKAIDNILAALSSAKTEIEQLSADQEAALEEINNADEPNEAQADDLTNKIDDLDNAASSIDDAISYLNNLEA